MNKGLFTVLSDVILFNTLSTVTILQCTRLKLSCKQVKEKTKKCPVGSVKYIYIKESFPVCVSAWKDRPQCFQTRLRRPVWCVELGNHPGKTNNVVSLNMKSYLLLCLSECELRELLWWGKPVKVAGLCFAFSMSWPREGSLTPSGIVSLISWHKWWKVSLPSSATQRRGSSPPSSSTLSTYGKHHYIQSYMQAVKSYRLCMKYAT